LKKWNPEHVNS